MIQPSILISLVSFICLSLHYNIVAASSAVKSKAHLETLCTLFDEVLTIPLPDKYFYLIYSFTEIQSR